MSSIQKAFNFAYEKHSNQKYGQRPYICHLMGVASGLETDQEIIIALLHDTIEDTETTYEELKQEFGLIVATTVITLSEKESIKYFDYIYNIKNSSLATKIKLADIKFNLANNPPESLKKRYLKALSILESK